MHDMKLVLFGMPHNLTAFARSATPRDRDAHKHHKPAGLKAHQNRKCACQTSQDEQRQCRADDGHGGSEDV
jgi:hypothetical protein